IFEAVRSISEPESIWNYGFPTSIWRHFERLPLGVLPIADSLCRLNPFHGYGMSVAAQQARLLQALLGGSAEKVDPLAAVSTDFLAQVGSLIKTPWALSTSVDLAFAATRGERPQNFSEVLRQATMLYRAAIADPVIQASLMKIIQLAQPCSL